jgi:hypothetical protein
MTAHDEELELLLPWYVNGTLDAARRRHIDEALAHDGRLRRALALAREDQEAVVETHELIAPPSNAPLDRIMAEVAGAGRARQHALKLSLADAFKGFLVALSPRTLAVATAAMAVVIAVQTATIGLMSLKGPGPELASVEPGGQAENTARFIVGFAPGATAQQITALFDGAGLKIISGPAGGGLYIVEAALTEATGPGGEKVLQQLQARSDIIAFSAKAPAQEN